MTKRRKPHPVRARRPRVIAWLTEEEKALLENATGLLRQAADRAEARSGALRSLIGACETLIAAGSFDRAGIDALAEKLAATEAVTGDSGKPKPGSES